MQGKGKRGGKEGGKEGRGEGREGGREAPTQVASHSVLGVNHTFLIHPPMGTSMVSPFLLSCAALLGTWVCTPPLQLGRVCTRSWQGWVIGCGSGFETSGTALSLKRAAHVSPSFWAQHGPEGPYMLVAVCAFARQTHPWNLHLVSLGSMGN